MSGRNEIFISVDVETAGPIPGEFSLLSIGACAVFEPSKTFACTVKPINHNFDPKALEVSGLSLDELAQTGLDPADAMRRFADWLSTLVRGEEGLVFVGLNAPFDWSFVNYYFHRFGVSIRSGSRLWTLKHCTWA
jgi:ribonuclease T